MAENKEYRVRSGEDGNVQISEEVICTIAAAAVLDVDGVESLSSGPLNVENIAEKLSKSATRLIKLTVNDTSLSIECGIIVAYGYDVVEVAKNVQLSVSNAVSSMTGFTIEKVDIHVSSIAVARKKQ